MEMQQAQEERPAFWVTNWKRGNAQELSASLPSDTVNLYRVLGQSIPTEMCVTSPSLSLSLPFDFNSVCIDDSQYDSMCYSLWTDGL